MATMPPVSTTFLQISSRVLCAPNKHRPVDSRSPVRYCQQVGKRSGMLRRRAAERALTSSSVATPFNLSSQCKRLRRRRRQQEVKRSICIQQACLGATRMTPLSSLVGQSSTFRPTLERNCKVRFAKSRSTNRSGLAAR
jgi:hypothetical protein